MGPSSTARVARQALLTRAVVICCQLVANSLVPDHQADAFYPQEWLRDGRPADLIVDTALGGLGKWDSAHFLDIAEHGYVREESVAFLPLYPLLIRLMALSVFRPLLLFLTMHSVLLITGVLLNFFLFIGAAVVFYKLSLAVLKAEPLAYRAAMFFCINPASIFMSAVYTETLFALLSFGGMLFVASKDYWKAAVLFMLATGTRSNGLVLAGFFAYPLTQEFVGMIVSGPLNDRRLKRFGYYAWKLTTCCLLLISPFLAFEYFTYKAFCPGTEHAIGQNFEWCEYDLPLSYPYVQAHYWNNGLFRYYQWKQIPNFILALPIVTLSLQAAIDYCKHRSNYFKVLGLYSEFSTTNPSHYGYLGNQTFVYVPHMLFLLSYGLLTMNVQVLTRFICSSCPIIYWYAAYLTEQSNSSIYPDIKQFIMYTWSNKNSKPLVGYFISYFVLGIIFHTNFLPWT